MRKILKSIGIGLAVAVGYVWIMLPMPLGMHYWQSSQYISTLERMEKGYRERFTYLFEGALQRGLIDLCEDDAGEVGVFWKEECK